MGSKMGLILSIGIIFFIFLFGADLVMLQLNYVDLDSHSAYISYLISKNPGINEELIKYCESKNILITDQSESDGSYQKGDLITYTLEREYTPLVMGNQSIEISITRYAVISILN